MHELQGNLENGSIGCVIFGVGALGKLFELFEDAIHQRMIVEVREVLEKAERKLGKRT